MGRIAGIARHDRPLGPMEVLDRAELIEGQGIAGDFRGTRKAGSLGQNGVVLIEADDWAAAVEECRAEVPWFQRRANLLVEGLDLPQQSGVRLRIGDAVLVEITQECAPCERMEALHPGLRNALTPDWRAGARARVVSGGFVAVGDEIRAADA
ncbi:MAG TPA: MOSC domain-containing protein [Sphingomicrobium sp.]|jgi:MOSC domain-containing protein YiiM|nr:MOSC domain-containing protein [Sphingomicrobium sp.]